MLTQPLLDKLAQLRLSAFPAALEEQLHNPQYADLPFEDRLGLLVADDLPQVIDPGLWQEVGWKTRVRHGSIEYHCYPEHVSVEAELDSVEFVFDPEDTLQLYIEVNLGE